MLFIKSQFSPLKIFIFQKSFNRNKSSIINEAREILRVLGGGEINFEKDEASGIASLTINNIAKKNAISGRTIFFFF